MLKIGLDFLHLRVYNIDTTKGKHPNKKGVLKMAKVKTYYGLNYEESRVMFAIVTGEMADGTLVYTECDGFGNLIDIDKQYRRTLKYGSQIFLYI